MNLHEARAVAEALARRAGDVVLTYWAGPLQETTKANANDIVTEGDKASEAVLVAGLRAAFPDHGIVSEEGAGNPDARDPEVTWYIDPIDGTTNFAHGMTYFAVSLGLADARREPLVGVVFNPVTGELFSAARGQGATLNGRPIQVARTESLGRALLATGFSTDKARAEQQLVRWRALLHASRDLRRLGSAALDMAYVAAGRLDAFWETGINAWDLMAAVMIVREAGGRATDFQGGSERLFTGQEVVVSNGALHDELLRRLNEAG